jgi:hypothetical protein
VAEGGAHRCQGLQGEGGRGEPSGFGGFGGGVSRVVLYNVWGLVTGWQQDLLLLLHTIQVGCFESVGLRTAASKVKGGVHELLQPGNTIP